MKIHSVGNIVILLKVIQNSFDDERRLFC